MTVNVEWRAIPDWPYEVSADGRVRNARTGRVLKQRAHKSGYLEVQMWSSMRYVNRGVHQLVALCFIGPKPEDKDEVAHKNGNRHDNHFGNLKWATHLENMADRDSHGTTAINKTNGKTKHDELLVAGAKALIRSGKSFEEVSIITGIPKGTLYGYVSGIRRTYIN